jgi:sirohydrochlorin ferrochelatase
MPADIPLIGLAHGSRHAEVSASVSGLMATAGRLGSIPTATAYLDLTAPDLATTAGALVEQRFQRAVVAPLLFTSAFHATVDVPQAVAAAAAETGLELVVADILGTGADMLAVLATSMAAAGIGDDTPVLLFSVGSSDQAANDAIQSLAGRLEATRSAPVRAAFGTRAPRADAVLAELPPPAAIVPLFISPGLLLDPLVALSKRRGLVLAPPLGDLVAPLLLQRYAAALT